MNNFLGNISKYAKAILFILPICALVFVLIWLVDGDIESIYFGFMMVIFSVFLYFHFKKTIPKIENGVLRFFDFFYVLKTVEVAKIKTLQLKYFTESRSIKIFLVVLGEKIIQIDTSNLSKRYVTDLLNEIIYLNPKVILLSKDSTILSVAPENVSLVVNEMYKEGNKFKLF